MIFNTPRVISWNYTDKCNLNCLHCYSRNRHASVELSTPERIKAAQRIINAQVFEVLFGGGEPLMEEDLFQVIQTLSDHGVETKLSTHGMYADVTMFDKLKTAGLTGLNVSMDSLSSTKHDMIRRRNGCHSAALKTIKHSIQNEIQTSIALVISEINWMEIEDFIIFFANIGVKVFNISRYRPVGNGLENRDIFELTSEHEQHVFNVIRTYQSCDEIRINFIYGEHDKSEKIKKCPCGTTSLALMPNGDIQRCVYGCKVLGNILHDDLRKIWTTNDYLKKMRRENECEGLVNDKGHTDDY